MTDALYDHAAVEEKWQSFWEDQKLFQHSEKKDAVVKDPLYLLFAFAYPSGSGLHVGHVESKTALDIMARYSRMQGKDVFFPVGWDAFGLPAENYAIKTGIPPATTTKDAITTFRRQIKRIGISYDWGNELATNHPEYYRWTQWLFIQLYKKGLAYQGTGMVNWCPSCQTVLANEQVVEGKCERCSTEVTQKNMKQWFFKITQYRDELISGLDTVDWPAATKQQQLNWIGKSEGINITYKIVDSKETITCFTTTPVNFGATFLVIAPENSLVEKITTPEQRTAVAEYVSQVAKRSELDRTINKEKTGVFTGAYVENHVTGENIPVYVADFVLAHVGTGAVQGCPGHDERDFEFAQKFGIPIKRVVVGDDGDTSPVERKVQLVTKGMNGKMINSQFLDGVSFKEAMQKTMDYFEDKKWGERVITYKLRDWLISRQRYWGAPIPVIYDPAGEPHVVDDASLPWVLPTDVDFKPTGESPLVSSKEFQARTEQYAATHHADLIKQNGWDATGKGWRPEYDTMDTFVDSSWYYLRYVDSRNSEVFSSPEQLKKWLPVDFYMIGPEHIVLHLLYSRFFTKFLRDEGYLQFDEPFMKMRHQGMILGPDGKKMSKSKGNVINPDEIIEKFGADTLRMYEMFMGPIEADKPWDVRAVVGIYKFLQRLNRKIAAALEQTGGEASENSQAVQRKLHQTIQKVTQDIPSLKFNTAIAALMELLNTWEQAGEDVVLSKEDVSACIRVVAPFAPFLAEELWQQSQAGDKKQLAASVHLQSWPTWDSEIAREEFITLAVQVNGKLRAELKVTQEQSADKQAVLEQAKALPDLEKYLAAGSLVKEIYVPGRIISFVVR